LNGAWTPSFYGYDGGGNVRTLTNTAGAITDSYEYDAFGNSFTVSGSTPNEMIYRGEQYDSDLGLYYLRARYYNPITGRFMSRDPLDGYHFNPKTLHKYLYAGGDPVNAVDPTGREELADYAIRISTTLKATVVLNSIACGVGISSSLATGTLLESLGTWQGKTSVAFLAFGCLTMTVEAGKVVQLGFDGAGLAGCGWGLYQTYEDENAYFENPTEANLQVVDADLVGSIGGCALTLAALGAEP
jgi:RHS repeat-associated protein